MTTAATRFVAAATFAGKITGYVFTTRGGYTGYYVDDLYKNLTYSTRV